MINRYLIVMLASVCVASFSQVLLKASAQRKYDSFLKEYWNPYVIGGYGMLFVSMLLTILAYRGLDYKNGPVIEALGNGIVMLLSYAFFQEKIGLRKIVGMLCILAGVVVFHM